MSHDPDDRLVSTSLPNEAQLRVIFGVVVLLVVALVVTAPYAHLPTHGTEIFVPAYAAAIFVVELTTAAILLATFQVRLSVRLLVLAGGYLLSGILSVPWALTFPGVFTSLGLDQNLQATAWIAAIRRIGFAVAVVGYAVTRPSWTARFPARLTLGCVAGVTAFVACTLWIILSGDGILPHFMIDSRNTAPAWGYVPALALSLYVIALAALFMRCRSTLDIWMCVVVFSLSVEILLISYLSGAVRLSVGWWSGRFFGLVAAGTILLVLLAETTGNYMRLARAAANERRARLNRLTAMEALSASIAHEINQPLSSMVTDANAAMRWLKRDDPQIERAHMALQRIADEGLRADKIISGIRQMFLKGAQERVQVDVKSIIEDALMRGARDRELSQVEVRKLYSPSPPKAAECNPVQLHNVVSNLLDNAVDAMKDGGTRRRRTITIGVEDGDTGEIEVSIADAGPGVPPELADRIFLPFVSTKPEGTGMGLMFSRSVIEAHGGRIWIAPNRPSGAIVRFTLPAALPPQQGAEQ